MGKTAVYGEALRKSLLNSESLIFKIGRIIPIHLTELSMYVQALGKPKKCQMSERDDDSVLFFKETAQCSSEMLF